jgi:hypothetical protein
MFSRAHSYQECLKPLRAAGRKSVEHPSEETLKRFVAGISPRDESRSVVAHLLKGCAPCARKIRLLMEPPPVRRDGYDSALERFDHELVETLESSISPVQTLRTALSRMLDEDRKPPGGKPRHREH